MAATTPFDWLNASIEQRRALYAAVKLLVDLGRIDWNAFYERSLGRSPGSGYHDNFRKGINSRKDCARMFLFLRHEFPDAAENLGREFGGYTSDSLDRFVRQYGSDGRLAAVCAKPGGQPDFVEPPGFHGVHYGEPFYLQFDSPLHGSAICLRQDDNYWIPQILSSSFDIPVTIGRQWVTRGADGKTPRSLVITDERQLRASYVLIAGEDGLIRTLTEGWRDGYPLRERHVDIVPDRLQARPGGWIITHTSFYLMPSLDRP